MADQLFKKRKAKKAAELARKQAARDSYDKVLIVCEGCKTKPNYLKELIKHYKLSTANVALGAAQPKLLNQFICGFYRILVDY